MIQTEYDFKLPGGYIDNRGQIHRDGKMRLATAADEIEAARDPRVLSNPEYMSVVLLSKVITKLGELEMITPKIIEGLFVRDMDFLKNMYQTINDVGEPVMHIQCPHCGEEFESKIAAKTEEIRTLKAGLSGIVRQYGFATVQDFYTAFYTAQNAFDQYQKDCARWDKTYGEKVTPRAENMHEKIQWYQEKADRQNASQPFRNRYKGAR